MVPFISAAEVKQTLAQVCELLDAPISDVLINFQPEGIAIEKLGPYGALTLHEFMLMLYEEALMDTNGPFDDLHGWQFSGGNPFLILHDIYAEAHFVEVATEAPGHNVPPEAHFRRDRFV